MSCEHPKNDVASYIIFAEDRTTPPTGQALLQWCAVCGAVRCGQGQWAKPQEQVVDMLLWCPQCNKRHYDEGEFAGKPHSTHACQHCGMCWKPAKVPTRGVRFLPGYKNPASATLTVELTNPGGM
jgi:hypothetical protein